MKYVLSKIDKVEGFAFKKVVSFDIKERNKIQ